MIIYKNSSFFLMNFKLILNTNVQKNLTKLHFLMHIIYQKFFFNSDDTLNIYLHPAQQMELNYLLYEFYAYQDMPRKFSPVQKFILPCTFQKLKFIQINSIFFFQNKNFKYTLEDIKCGENCINCLQNCFLLTWLSQFWNCFEFPNFLSLIAYYCLKHLRIEKPTLNQIRICYFILK